MQIDIDVILKFATLLGALGAIWAVAYRFIKWFQKQEQQTADIAALRALHIADINATQSKESADMQTVKEELCVLSYAMLAALDGLKQQGCNGEVTRAHNMLEKHLNKQAHN